MTRRDGLTTPEALERLTSAILALALRGGRPRCGDPATHELWTSDSGKARATAASWCAGCPVMAECGLAADAAGERFGVWGGRDRTAWTRPTTGGGSA